MRFSSPVAKQLKKLGEIRKILILHRIITVPSLPPKTALEIRQNGRRQKIAVIYVLLDGSSAAKISA